MIKTGLLLLFCVVFASCATIRVSHDYDKTAPFGNYKTYAFTAGTQSLPVDEDTQLIIVGAVEQQLKNEGLSKTDGAPDVWIELHVFYNLKQSSSAAYSPYNSSYAYYWSNGFTSQYINMNNFKEGTLFIDMIDVAKKQLVWQGRANGTVDSELSTPQREKNIYNAMERVFTYYPPKI